MGGETEQQSEAEPTGGPIELQPASPTLEEGLTFARLADQAFGGGYQLMLGRRAHDFIARAYLQLGHDLSYRYTTFAIRHGTILGMVAGYTGEEHFLFTKEPLQDAAGWRRHRMNALSWAGRRTKAFIDSIPEDDFYIRALAVDPEYRGQGVGALLLDHIEAAARAAGSSRLSLDVEGGNTRAQALYRRFGMTVTDELPRLLGIPRTDILRMSKDL